MTEKLDYAIGIGERGLVILLILGVAIAMLWGIAFLFRYCTDEWQNPTPTPRQSAQLSSQLFLRVSELESQLRTVRREQRTERILSEYSSDV